MPQATPGISISLKQPVNNTHDIVNTALEGLRLIYLKGYMYQKVEVTATGLIPETEVQLDMFNTWNGIRNDKLSKIMDSINKHYGTGTLRIASEGSSHSWTTRKRFLSPSYTSK